jgi:hypothetical protein
MTVPTPDSVVLTFAPVHKRAMGLAVALVAGGGCFLLTAVPLLRGRPPELMLELLDNYFYGYTVSWTGALIGAWWAGVTGFVAGWFLAFLRNGILAVRLVLLRARADLARTRDFMDHI